MGMRFLVSHSRTETRCPQARSPGVPTTAGSTLTLALPHTSSRQRGHVALGRASLLLCLPVLLVYASALAALVTMRNGDFVVLFFVVLFFAG